MAGSDARDPVDSTGPVDPLRRRVRLGALHDLYGALLTPRQRRLMELCLFDDLSLGEIAAEAGVTRQAVHDVLERAGAVLERYEGRLGLLTERERRDGMLSQLAGLLEAGAAGGAAALQRARELVALLAEDRPATRGRPPEREAL